MFVVWGKKRRDYQRSKVYAAERSIDPGERFKTLVDAQVFVNNVLADPWVRATWPRTSKQGITLSDGRRRRSAAAFIAERRIALPRWARTEQTTLHEIAHILTSGNDDHGPLFCATYALLVEHFQGTLTGVRLIQAFEDKRVNVVPKS